MNLKLNVNKIKTITVGDEAYPENLMHIYGKPQTLYVLGNEKLLDAQSIAIIGCRKASSYGLKSAYKFGYELAKKGICVVSGFARGIDSYAHKGALAAKGATIAVLGCGLDVVYPPENVDLYKQIVMNNGAIITEYPLGSRPEKHHFPARNRIISGLSDGVLVVEAKERSGTLITVEYALEQGKNVYAIPGNITSENSYGTNELIKEGAIPITKIEDFEL